MSNYITKKIAHEVKRNKFGNPIIINKKYSIKEKIDYYSNRINDDTLSNEQRNYARIKVNMLKTGVGRIYLINDDLLGNTEYTGEFKKRRVVPTAINELNNNVLINGIYSKPNRFSTYKVKKNTYINGINHEIPILEHDSYLHVKTKRKLDDTFFNLKDLQETTSTMNPLEWDNVLKYVYPKNETKKSHRENNFLRRLLKR